MTSKEFRQLVDAGQSDFSGADLSNLTLSRMRLVMLDLNHADLRYTDFEGSDLSYTNLAFANLRGAHLDHTILRGANLYMTNLSDTDLFYAHLYEAKILGCVDPLISSHDFIYAALTYDKELDVRQRMIAGLVITSRDWCWNDMRTKLLPQLSEEEKAWITVCLAGPDRWPERFLRYLQTYGFASGPRHASVADYQYNGETGDENDDNA